MKMHNGRMTALAALAVAASVASAQGIDVTVNGDPVYFTGAQPQSMNGRVMVPLRGVFEKLGAYVNWDPQMRQVFATRGSDEVRLNVGSRTAWVNGSPTTLDVPARIVNGSTMVPLRFLSESLGASVDWNSPQRMVMINTNGGRAQVIDGNRRYDNQDLANNRSNQRNVYDVIEANTVVPVTLDDTLSSNGSQRGDRFTATVRTSDGDYLGLPNGTRFQGRVTAARPKTGNQPGALELAFNRLVLPNGRSYPINGSLFSLDNTAVDRQPNGRLVARPEARNNRIVYAGYGAGAGLLVGLLTKRPLESALLGGILGYAVGSTQKAQDQPSNVRLNPGTQFGVKLNSDVALTRGR